jgi:MFS family permease
MATGAGLSFVFAFVGGYLTDRIGMPKTFALTGFATAALLVPLVVGFPGGSVYIVLLFIPTEIAQVAFQKYMTTIISETRRATFVGAVNTLIGLIAPLSVVLAGQLYVKAKMTPFVIAAAASLLSIGALPFLVRIERQQKTSNVEP